MWRRVVVHTTKTDSSRAGCVMLHALPCLPCDRAAAPVAQPCCSATEPNSYCSHRCRVDDRLTFTSPHWRPVLHSHTLCGSRMNRVLCGTVWKCEGVERGVASAVSKHPLPSRSSGPRRRDANADSVLPQPRWASALYAQRRTLPPLRRTRSQPLCILQLCRLRRRVSRWRPYRNRHVHNRSLTYISMLVARMVQIGMQETLHRPARPRRARREIGSADLRHLSREPRAGLWLCETASLRLRLLPDGNFWATAAGRHDGPRWCGSGKSWT